MGAGGFGIGAKVLEWLAKRGLHIAHKTGERLEAEKADLRADLIELLHMLEKASTKAQMAVNSSSNQAGDAHAAAVETATQAGQRVANLFQVKPGATLSQGFMEARLAFRETTTDEDNPALMDKDMRRQQCDRIEAACALFHNEIANEAFRRYGQGIGPRSGILKGRKIKR